MVLYPDNIPGHVLNFFNDAIAAALQFFHRLMTSSGMVPFYTAMIFIFLVGRFILVPLFGIGAGSDSARKHIRKEVSSSKSKGNTSQ